MGGHRKKKREGGREGVKGGETLVVDAFFVYPHKQANVAAGFLFIFLAHGGGWSQQEEEVNSQQPLSGSHRLDTFLP